VRLKSVQPTRARAGTEPLPETYDSAGWRGSLLAAHHSTLLGFERRGRGQALVLGLCTAAWAVALQEEWDDGVAGSSSVGPRWNAPDPPRCLHLQRTWQLQLSKCMRLLCHPPPSDVCKPSPSKGLSGVSLSVELAAAGRWSYGNERCVGDLATVLLHSCVRPAPPLGSDRSECGNWGQLV
jgi:hypothetical protein